MARLPVEVAVEVDGASEISNLSDDFAGLEKIGTGAMERIGHKITDFATNLISTGVSSLIDAIGNSVELASDKVEAAGKAGILFGDAYGQVATAAQTAATDIGLSSGKYLDLAGTLGNLTTNLGFSKDAAAGMSVDMLKLAADMGSFNNASTEDVVFAMGAAFRGETEPIRQYGVFLDEARIKAKATELGLYAGVGALDANGKAQATYALILEQTTSAQGNFALTAQDAANNSKINAALQEESWTRFGASLIPVKVIIDNLVTTGVNILTGALNLMADNIPVVIAVLGPLGVMIAATIVPPFIAWAAATLAATWPILAIMAAVALLVKVLDELGIIDWLIGLFGDFAGMLKGPVDFAIGIVQGALNMLKPVFAIIGGVVGVLGDVFKKVFDFIAGIVADVIAGMQRGFTVLQGAFNVIVSGLQAVGAFFSGIFTAIANTVRGAIDSVLGIFRSLWDGILSVGRQIMTFLGGLFQPLFDSVNKVINLAKDIWNGFVRFWNGFEIRIPAIKVADFQITPELVFGLPNLPTLAKGGIVTKPTLAMIGEAGAEAVVPLGRHGGMGGSVTINVNTGVGDPVAIGREVVDALAAYQRANGPLPLAVGGY